MVANLKKWSGDHCSFDYKTEPGAILSNRKFSTDVAQIMDLGPTVLKYFGLDVPKDMDGKVIF